MSVQRVRERLRAASRVAVLTGAGVSAASGVPTFRGSDGLWRQFRPEALATAEAFARNPALVWEWYAWRRELIARCEPNAAHAVLAAWSRARACQVITQNVDDLHLRAGTPNLVRLHGSLWTLRCWDGCAAGRAGWRDERVPLPEQPPRCPHCGGLARPGVVWFGESLDEADVEAASRAALEADVFLTVGTAAVVYPAAGLVQLARRAGAFTVEINADPTPATGLVDVALQGRAEQLLPQLSA